MNQSLKAQGQYASGVTGSASWLRMLCGLMLAALLSALAGCATAPSDADMLASYRTFGCEPLDKLDRDFTASFESATVPEAKAVWKKYVDMVRQARAEKGCSKKAVMGVRLGPIDPALVKPLGLESARGTVITEVMKAMPAERAGLLVGDIILGINGEGVATPAEAIAAIGKIDPGSKGEMLIWRSGKRKTIQVDFASESTDKAAPAGASLIDAAASDFDAGRYADAARKYQQILQQSPNDALAWYFFGQSMEKLGDVVGAQEAYRRVLAIQPKGQVADYARQALARLAPPSAGGAKKVAKKK